MTEYKNGATMPLPGAHVAGSLQLHVQEAHWIANTAAAQAQQMERALAGKTVPIQHIRETEAMMKGLRNLSVKATQAFNELAHIEQAKLEQQKEETPNEH